MAFYVVFNVGFFSPPNRKTVNAVNGNLAYLDGVVDQVGSPIV
jgi:hypothetical protein